VVWVTYLGEAAADGAGLLDAEVQGLELLALVELAEVGPGLLVDDGEDASDRLANGAAAESTVEWWASGEGEASTGQLGLGRRTGGLDGFPGRLVGFVFGLKPKLVSGGRLGEREW